jgi:hypothetical protein
MHGLDHEDIAERDIPASRTETRVGGEQGKRSAERPGR